MNKLQEQIENVLDDLHIIASDGITIPEAAQSCTTITIEFVKGFHKWYYESRYILHGEAYIDIDTVKEVPFDEIISNYIKTL